MQKDVAELLSTTMLRHGAEIDQLLLNIQPKCTREQFDVIKLMMGKVMGSIYLDCLYVVFSEHPDLKPEGLN
jgi:hypothetical protein